MAGAFLDGVIVASVALMAFVAIQLGRSALVNGEPALSGAQPPEAFLTAFGRAAGNAS